MDQTQIETLERSGKAVERLIVQGLYILYLLSLAGMGLVALTKFTGWDLKGFSETVAMMVLWLFVGVPFYGRKTPEENECG
jgi:predicted membrane channel-forming protein YqfA (hemolysin III family)